MGDNRLSTLHAETAEARRATEQQGLVGDASLLRAVQRALELALGRLARRASCFFRQVAQRACDRSVRHNARGTLTPIKSTRTQATAFIVMD